MMATPLCVSSAARLGQLLSIVVHWQAKHYCSLPVMTFYFFV